MALAIDMSTARAGLLQGEHLRDGGVSWVCGLVRDAAAKADLSATVRGDLQPSNGSWPVELIVNDRPLVLIDVDVGTSSSSLDALELRAMACWRNVGHGAANGVRPWLAAVRVGDQHSSNDGVRRLAGMVASRTLDIACVIEVDQVGQHLWSPNPAMSLDALQAAVFGRCLTLGQIGGDPASSGDL